MSREAVSGALPRGEVSAEVAATRRELDEARAAGRELLAPLTPAQWGWRPAKERWSIGDCVAHLVQTNRVYVEAIEAAIAKGRERGLVSDGPYHHGFLGEFMIREMEPPPRRRFRAPRPFLPPVGEVGPEALGEFEAGLVRMIDALRTASGLDLGKVSVVSPANRFLRLSLGQSFRLAAAHVRRHLGQAKRVTEEPAYPRAPSSAG